jgi:FkbM family methyltransferase
MSNSEIHEFANGVRVHRSHLLALQMQRYRIMNLHEPVEEHWFREICEAGGGGTFRFADVGAGIGYYSILLKQLNPAARIFCFEPFDIHANYLRANLLLNGIADDTVSIFENAVSDQVGSSPFYRQDYSSRLLDADDAGATNSVPTTTVAWIVQNLSGPLDLIKVDVQGAELRVIDGAAPVVGQIGAWIIGTHGKEVHSACVDRLRELGYQIACDDAAPAHQPDGLIVARARPTSRAPGIAS